MSKDKKLIDLTLSELVDQSLEKGLIPIFEFVDKETIVDKSVPQPKEKVYLCANCGQDSNLHYPPAFKCPTAEYLKKPKEDKPDWEITKYEFVPLSKPNEPFYIENNSVHWENAKTNKDYKIFEVKRLSDMTTWTAKESITSQNDFYTIEGFEIMPDNKTLHVIMKEGGFLHLRELEKLSKPKEEVKAPLFITGEGVGVFDGDPCWYVDSCCTGAYKTIWKKGLDPFPGVKYFQYKENAKEYFKKNKSEEVKEPVVEQISGSDNYWLFNCSNGMTYQTTPERLFQLLSKDDKSGWQQKPKSGFPEPIRMVDWEKIESIMKGMEKSKSLFTTEDGIEIFDGWKYSAVQKITFDILHGCIHPLSHPDSWVTFSTKEKAEEYAKINKPLNISMKEIGGCIINYVKAGEPTYKGTAVIDFEKLNELIKSKLSQS
jgi:hypothetical protein